MMRSLIRLLLGAALRTRATRTIALALAYSLVLGVCLLFAYQLRFDFAIEEWVYSTLLTVFAVTIGVHLLSLAAFDQFDGLLSYFGRPDLKRLVLACTTAALILGAIRLLFGVDVSPPRGVILVNYLLCIAALSAMRLSFRRIRMIDSPSLGRMPAAVRRVAIFGAGDCGALLANEFLSKPWLALQPIAFFDDRRDSSCRIHGIPLIGRPERLVEVKEKLRLDEFIIAAPSASAKRIRDIVKLTHAAGLPCRTVPSLDQLATGRCSVTNLRPVEIQDLLGREQVKIEGEAVREIIAGRAVMVTGAGGSIGSELCRQILDFRPACLVLVERSEPQLFLIDQELRNTPTEATLWPVVGDVTRRGRMGEIFRRFQPDVVFHAAAHKHVPMMELQPEEAIRNNVFGTALLADLAVENAVRQFIFVSTDKAVNPTNVMGATKRLAEMYLQSRARHQSTTKFMAVRFGNVLGSSGSVVPTFERQIAAGGPVTVTHPEVTRFFMTIPEAVSLVLQSSAFGKGGDIFVLDMGERVRILDLAMQMIGLSGLTPHEDIEIVFTGMRPGEKLYEEVSNGGENVTATGHPKIARLVAPALSETSVASWLAELGSAVYERHLDSTSLKVLLAKILPEYKPFFAASAAHPLPHVVPEVQRAVAS